VTGVVLVPAALSLLGERAWWPPRWLRWLPVLDVEGEGLRTVRSTCGAAAGARHWGVGSDA
jgi:RND superfamily putative drug exporter